jgi:Ni,Fe-hydrogenase III component G
MDDAHYSEFMIIASVDIPHNDLTIRTITDIVPGALFMEREVMEMLGIVIEDIPDSRRLFTPSSLQDGYFPLRNGKNKEDSK